MSSPTSTTSSTSFFSAADSTERGWSDSTLVSPISPAALSSSEEKREKNFVVLAPLPEIAISLKEKRLDVKAETVPVKGPKARARPAKKDRTLRDYWLEFNLFFTMYRKFFLFVVTLNAVGIALACRGRFWYAEEHSGALILGNLLCAVMMRNEIFLRFLYLTANTLFAKWPPLFIRLGITSALQHIGGIHSGCATSGLGWIIFKVVDMCRHRKINHGAVIATGITTNVAIIISVISAFPWIRNSHHNVFERQHRFIGWLGLASTWVFVLLGNFYDADTDRWDPSVMHLIGIQEFWFALGMTVFIALPWTFTRRVPVEVEIPSPKVAIIRFKRGIQQGLLGRISRTSLMEYHAFGIVSEGTQSDCHYMVCGVQGDFTRGLVENPPKALWTRELKFAGVSNTSRLYQRGIRICTGTGIGAGLSTCLQNPNWFLIWIGSDQQKTFGSTLCDLIERIIEPERRILWDSKKRGGRPDTMNLLQETFIMWRAEVVFITSNDQGNREMMLGCRERGIPAFGTLFDF